MDLVHDGTSIIAEDEEDMISNLSDDIIYRFLSFLDLKYDIQFRTLTRNWKDLWTSISHCNLNSQLFRNVTHFANFVKCALSHHNYQTKASTVELQFTEEAIQFDGRSIVNYAYTYIMLQNWILYYAVEYTMSSHNIFSVLKLLHISSLR